MAGVSKRFGKVEALRRVDLDLQRGRLTALLGPNGAGKTTAVRLFLGLTRPSGGTVTVCGGDPRAPSIRRRRGAMLQVAKVPETLKVREHLDLFSSYYPRPLPPEQVIAVAGLEGLEERKFGELSGGQRQRVLFALALCGDPELLFLDEPTVGLDVSARLALWDRIRELVEQGRSVLLTTHYMEEADALADRVVVLDRGRIVADGTPADIKRRVAGRRIRCRTRLEDGELWALPGVTRLRRTGGIVELLVREAETLLRELLARDPSLKNLEVESASLEEAFLALTHGSSRAGGAAADRTSEDCP